MNAKEIRKLSLEAVYKVGKGHLGGVLSCAEIFSVLYSKVLRNQGRLNADRFILSKGHAAISLYATLALAGYFPIEEMWKLNQEGMLGEEPNNKIPGVEVNSGSLGHGLGLACGIALANKMNRSEARTFVLLGDGECWEGSIWEAAMFGAHHNLNITVIVDRNGYCVQGDTESVMGLEPLGAKWCAFGWDVRHCDGHDEDALRDALAVDGPRVVVAKTVKGRGVSFMEGKKEWHHGSLNDAQLAQALEEINGNA